MADITQKDGQDVVHGCGYEAGHSIIFRLDTNRGDIKWINKVGSDDDTDMCRGITNWNEQSGTGADLLVALIESDGGSNFGGKDTGFKDAFLLVMDMSGDVLKAVQLSLKSASMSISDGSLIRYGNSFYFAGEA